MKATIFAITTIFSAALAAPSAKRSEYDINVAFINHGNGETVTMGIPSGNYPNPIAGIFRGTPIDVNGRIMAAFIQLGDNNLSGKGVTCTIKLDENTYRHISNWNPFLNLRGINSKDSTQVDLSDATIACYVDGESVAVINV